MKFNIYFEYRIVVFYDISVDEYFKIGSIIKIDCEIELDGVMYLYVIIDVFFKLYLFYIGKLRIVVLEGNVVRFI